MSKEQNSNLVFFRRLYERKRKVERQEYIVINSNKIKEIIQLPLKKSFLFFELSLLFRSLSITVVW